MEDRVDRHDPDFCASAEATIIHHGWQWNVTPVA